MSRPVLLKSGEQVKINDHVYCSPSWNIRGGTPYSIARIMEFLPPEDAPKGTAGENYLYTRVRLAWYYRPQDVTERAVADSRLLLAAVYSEVCDINQLRSKCHVVHRDKISDLAGWKKRPDRFYFNRLFDPYIKKEFEIIQATDVRNLPTNIRETLVSRYEYVIVEKEVIPDLTDSIRMCDTCDEWCPSPDTVKCDRCQKFFHMRCVQPPLIAKPSRGYGWTCAPCSRQHEEEVDSHEVRHVTPVQTKPKSNAPAPRGRGRPRKDKSLAEKEENLPIKHFNMWPFRYFGQYTVAEDTLDAEDLIFPRIGTRQGAKFQAQVPPAPELEAGTPAEPDERGGDTTVEVLGCINSLTEAEIAEVEKCKRKLTNDDETRQNVDWLTEVIRRFSEAALAARPFPSVHMKTNLRIQKWKKQETLVMDRPWKRDEIAAFEDGIMAHGPELRAVRDEVAIRSMPEIVRYYGHWKNDRLREENELARSSSVPKSTSRQYRSQSEANDGQRVGLSDDESSVVVAPSKAPTCAACRARESKAWWKAPKTLPTNLLCDSCGTNWRKYADLNVRPFREESVPKTKVADKREGTPLTGPVPKRAKTTSSAHTTPPPPPSNVPHLQCIVCLKSGPLGKVLACTKCKLRVHAGSCGAVVDPASVSSWVCDPCQNEETLEASINVECLLCPREPRIGAPQPPTNSFLRACKPTEGQGWAHVLCSVFIPELQFTEAPRLRLVEGVSVISRSRWINKCSICGETEGAVIRCSDCPKEFHASCAWSTGNKFGFEIQPVKSTRRDNTTVTTFKNETGCMNAVISCSEHDHSRRKIYGICETNDGGETALQVYCRAYKQAKILEAHGLLRKARRLDSMLNIKQDTITSNSTAEPPSAAPSPPSSFASTSSSPSPFVEPVCSQCHSQFSPYFHQDEDNPNRLLCHKCHFERGKDQSGGTA